MDVRRIPASYRISEVKEHNNQMDVRRIPASYRISEVNEHNSQMDVRRIPASYRWISQLGEMNIPANSNRWMSEGYQPATGSVR